jgi:hypothetical protein
MKKVKVKTPSGQVLTVWDNMLYLYPDVVVVEDKQAKPEPKKKSKKKKDK